MASNLSKDGHLAIGREYAKRIARHIELQDQIDKEREDAEAFFAGTEWTPEEEAFHVKQHDAHVRDAFPPLTFNSQQWWMAKPPQSIKWSEISDPTDWSTRDDRIMAAVRDIARGG